MSFIGGEIALSKGEKSIKGGDFSKQAYVQYFCYFCLIFCFILAYAI